MNRNALRSSSLAGLAGLLVLAILTAGCQRVAPIRTLPSWVRGIYVPVFKNETYEPEIEELATRLTQEAFLADGRVDIVPKAQADLVLKVDILDWQAETSDTRGDKIAKSDDIIMTVGIKLYDPFDLERPMADLGRFRITSGFNVDTRSNRYAAEPERKERLMSSLADQIVARVINGFPVAPAGVATDTNVPQFRTPETIQMDEVLKPRPEEDTPQ